MGRKLTKAQKAALRKRLRAARARKSSGMKIQRGLSPAVYPFKRSISTTIGLNTSAPPTDWNVSGNNLYRNWGFSLGQINDYQEFTNLFKYYRLKGVRVQMYFSNNVSTSEDGNNNSANQQILMWMDRNQDGSNFAAAGLEATYLDSQTAKKRLCLKTNGKPIDIYMPLMQQNMIFGNDGNTDYTVTKPKWIATHEPTTAHYGYKMMLQRVDGQPFTSGITNSQYCKIIQTLYFQCKKVE